MNRAVARRAFRRVGVALARGLPVNALSKHFHFLRVAFRTLSRRKLFRGDQFVHASVARSAGGFAQQRMHARGERSYLVRVAGGAIHLCESFPVWEIPKRN